jgi:protein gp37
VTKESLTRAGIQARIDLLRETGAHVKFLSLEPLLGPMNNLNLTGINWAIVGGESGPGARVMRQEWVFDIRNQCQAAGVPSSSSSNGAVLIGRRPDASLRTAPGMNWPRVTVA